MNADDSFRRFLERATEDPGSPMVGSGSRSGEHRRPEPSKLADRGRVLAAAAVVIVIAGWALTLRTQSDGSPTEAGPAAELSSVSTTEATLSVTESTTTSTALTASTTVTTVPTSTASTAVTTATTEATAVTGDEADAGESVVLDVLLPPSLAGADDGDLVQASTGPTLLIEKVGDGFVEAVPGGGVRFGVGGQQRNDYAMITRVGADVGELMPGEGRIEIRFTPQVDVVDRSVSTGRNIHTWFEVVSREGEDNEVVGLQLQVDPDVGPYLSGFVQSQPFNYTLTEADVDALGAGNDVTITVSWAGNEGRILLNDRVLTTVESNGNPAVWESTARLSIGGSASFGGGYFTAVEDAIKSFKIFQG